MKIRIPVELTFSVLNAQAAGRINALHAVTGEATVAEGDPNPYVSFLNDLAYGRHGFTRTSPIAETDDISLVEHIKLDAVDLVIGLGGDFVGLPAFFKIVPTDPCPFSTRTDPGPETWEEWSNPPHQVFTFGANSYKAAARNEYMDVSEWYPIMRGSVILVEEFRALNQSQEI